MNKINYIIGDATEPIGDDKKIIAHICNNIGGWGAGFVLALSKKWSQPEADYRAIKDKYKKLGYVQPVMVNNDIIVANMIAQEGLRPTMLGVPPIRYGALNVCMNKLIILAKENNASVHMPRIGSGLAGGDWDLIELIINKTLIINDIKTYVYDLPK